LMNRASLYNAASKIRWHWARHMYQLGYQYAYGSAVADKSINQRLIH